MNEQHRLIVDADHVSKRLLLVLVCFELLFVVLDIVINYFEVIQYSSIHELFNIAREDGLAGWFMTSQTLLAALILWLIYGLSHHVDGGEVLDRRGWLLLALFFTYMSADDGALIHERMGSMFEEMLEADKLDGSGTLAQWMAMFPSYEWQFMLPFFVLMGLFMLCFLWRALGSDKRSLLLVLVAFCSLACAVLLDFIEGLPEEHAFNVYSWLKQAYLLESYTVDHFARSLEEFLEMLGISLFLVVFVAQLKCMLPAEFVLCFSSSRAMPKV